jgi:hypothetical protein
LLQKASSSYCVAIPLSSFAAYPVLPTLTNIWRAV